MSGTLERPPSSAKRRRLRGLVVLAALFPLVVILADLWWVAPWSGAGIAARVFDGFREDAMGWLLVASGAWVAVSLLVVVILVARLGKGSGRKLGGPWSRWRVSLSALVAFSVVSTLAVLPYITSFYFSYGTVGEELNYAVAGRLALLVGPFGLVVALGMFIAAVFINFRARRRPGQA